MPPSDGPYNWSGTAPANRGYRPLNWSSFTLIIFQLLESDFDHFNPKRNSRGEAEAGPVQNPGGLRSGLRLVNLTEKAVNKALSDILCGSGCLRRIDNCDSRLCFLDGRSISFRSLSAWMLPSSQRCFRIIVCSSNDPRSRSSKLAFWIC